MMLCSMVRSLLEGRNGKTMYRRSLYNWRTPVHMHIAGVCLNTGVFALGLCMRQALKVSTTVLACMASQGKVLPTPPSDVPGKALLMCCYECVLYSEGDKRPWMHGKSEI